MKKVFLLILGLLLCELTFSQLTQNKEEGYVYPSSIPSKYDLNTDKEFQSLSQQKVSGEKQRDIERYAEAFTYGKKERITNGGVYFDFDQFEVYLTDILKKLIKDEKTINKVKIYLSTSPSTNAFAIHDGSLFVNIGLFAEASNEAELAFIVGHEVAHFINKDARESYFEQIKAYTKKKRRENYEMRLDLAHKDREQERAADLYSFEKMLQANYDLNAATSMFFQFLIEEKISESKKAGRNKIIVTNPKKSTKDLLSTHPEVLERMNYLADFIEEKKAEKGESFLVSSTTFKNLQQKARHETILQLFRGNRFDLSLEKAFLYYLSSPQDPFYSYYCLESIRRLIYFDVELKDKGFLTDDTPGIFKEGVGILTDIRYLVRDSAKFDLIKNHELLSKSSAQKFNTYDEAFFYFSDVTEQTKHSEAVLTKALYHYNDEEKRNDYLEEYMKNAASKNKKYARCLLNGTLHTSLNENKKKIFAFNDLIFFEDNYYGLHNRLIKADEKRHTYMSELGKMTKRYLKEYDFLDIETLRNNNYQEYIAFSDLWYSMSYFANFKIQALEFQQINSSDEIIYFDSPSDTEGELIVFDNADIPAPSLKTPKVVNELEEKEVAKEYPMNLFLFSPESWGYFEKEKVAALKLGSTVSIDDRTTIVSSVILDPLLYLIPFFWDYMFTKTSSDRYFYNSELYSFDVKNQLPLYGEENVNYKMTVPHFKNTYYHLINDLENEKK